VTDLVLLCFFFHLFLLFPFCILCVCLLFGCLFVSPLSFHCLSIVFPLSFHCLFIVSPSPLSFQCLSISIAFFRERPDPEKPAYEILLISATRPMIRKELQHQKDGHDPNFKFQFVPLPNLILTREDLTRLMKAPTPPVNDDDDTRLRRVHLILSKFAPPPIHETDDSVVDRRGVQGTDYVVINQHPDVPVVDTDIDKRCRTLVVVG
jgi:hypothetical protein